MALKMIRINLEETYEPTGMKERVQNEIDQIRKLAATPVKMPDLKGDADFKGSNNNLSKSIRNEAEANVFPAELDAVVKSVQHR